MGVSCGVDGSCGVVGCVGLVGGVGGVKLMTKIEGYV